MDLNVTVRPEVVLYSLAMEAKLRANDHKGHWASAGGEDLSWFVEKLRGEVEELEEALAIGAPLDVLEEAADVGNFAMMIADIILRKRGAHLGLSVMERATTTNLPRPLRAEGQCG